MSAARLRTPAITIGLLWHSPNSANLGIGALTLGNIALARRAAAEAGLKPRFKIIGFADPGKTNYVESEDVHVTALSGRAMLPGGALWAALGRCDVVLDIGGGDSFTDIYGAKRLAFLWWSKFVARLLGKGLVLSPQTIGPFGKPWSRLLASYILAQAEMVFARDPQSLAELDVLSPDARGALATDVAFAMPFERREHGPGIHVGINVSGLLFNGGYSGRNEFGLEIDYADFSRRLISALQEKPEVRVHLVAHVLSDELPQDDDRSAIRTLSAEFPGAICAPDFAGPIEAKSYIAGLDMLVGGRMHACIAAHSSGVPVIPVAYSRKFSGLFEGILGYPWIIPVKGMATDDAIDFVLGSLDRRDELATACAASRARVDELLDGYVNDLVPIFAAAAQDHNED